MRLTKIIGLCVAVTGLSATIKAQANVCIDDPRLYTIKSTIQKLDAGESIKPLKVTAGTFISLTPEVRAKLGDNILVFDEKCTPYQVYNGKPPVKVTIPFETQFQFFSHALARGDIESAKFAMDFF